MNGTGTVVNKEVNGTKIKKIRTLWVQLDVGEEEVEGVAAGDQKAATQVSWKSMAPKAEKAERVGRGMLVKMGNFGPRS
jgi:hypothetical protein